MGIVRNRLKRSDEKDSSVFEERSGGKEGAGLSSRCSCGCSIGLGKRGELCAPTIKRNAEVQLRDAQVEFELRVYDSAAALICSSTIIMSNEIPVTWITTNETSRLHLDV